jgi:hypothetical protein
MLVEAGMCGGVQETWYGLDWADPMMNCASSHAEPVAAQARNDTPKMPSSGSAAFACSTIVGEIASRMVAFAGG